MQALKDYNKARDEIRAFFKIKADPLRDHDLGFADCTGKHWYLTNAECFLRFADSLEDFKDYDKAPLYETYVLPGGGGKAWVVREGDYALVKASIHEARHCTGAPTYFILSRTLERADMPEEE